MKCKYCGIELSQRVCKIHETRCKCIDKKSVVIVEPVVIAADQLNIKQDGYTLEELLQMCINNQDIEYAPSTIKRWKEERARKELNL